MRVLRASPAFTIVALLSLALGIGATTAVFTVLDAVVMRPLAVSEPHRLVVVRALFKNERFVLFNPVYDALRSRQHALTDIAAVSDATVPAGQSPPVGPARRMSRAASSRAAISLCLRLQPAIGRGLTDADDRPGASCAAVISHRLWARDFHASSSVLGQVLLARGTACAIVGVMPEQFHGHQGGTRSTSGCRCGRFTWTAGQPHHGVLLGRDWAPAGDASRQEADSQLTALYQRDRGERAGERLPRGTAAPPRPPTSASACCRVHKGLGRLRDTFDESLTIIFGVVAAFLLIAAMNVGNLLLARGAARTTELATRAALGAGRGRLLRQLTTEGSSSRSPAPASA